MNQARPRFLLVSVARASSWNTRELFVSRADLARYNELSLNKPRSLRTVNSSLRLPIYFRPYRQLPTHEKLLKICRIMLNFAELCLSYWKFCAKKKTDAWKVLQKKIVATKCYRFVGKIFSVKYILKLFERWRKSICKQLLYCKLNTWTFQNYAWVIEHFVYKENPKR